MHSPTAVYVGYLPPRLSDMSMMALWDYTQAAAHACPGVAAAPRGAKRIYFMEVVQCSACGARVEKGGLALRETPDDEIKAAARGRRTASAAGGWSWSSHAAAVLLLLFTCCRGAAQEAGVRAPYPRNMDETWSLLSCS